MFGNDGDLDLALLDVKNRIRGIPLREDFLILAMFGNRSAAINFGQEDFRIKRRGCACQRKLSSLGRAQTVAEAYFSLPPSLIMDPLRGRVGNEDDRFVEDLTLYVYVLGR